MSTLKALWMSAAVLIAVSLPPQEVTTLSGCVERDAASRVPVYKLAVRTPAGPKVYRLVASGQIDLAAEVGHQVELTGTIGGDESRRGRETDFTVKTLKRLAGKCDVPERSRRPRASRAVTHPG